MPPGEEIDVTRAFDFLRLNIKAQKIIRARTMAMVRVVGENDDRKVALFRRLLRTMCSETGKPAKAVQVRLDACKLSVHCLYEIGLNDEADGKMVFVHNRSLITGQFQALSPRYFVICPIQSLCVFRGTYHKLGALSHGFLG